MRERKDWHLDRCLSQRADAKSCDVLLSRGVLTKEGRVQEVKMVGETLALLEAVVKATETCPAADEVHRSADYAT